MPLSRRHLMAAAAAIGAVSLSSRSLGASLERQPIREAGLVADFHFDAAARAAPAVILLNGSDGGMPSARDAADLAAAGIPTLALAYFKDWNGQPEGLPASLNAIPLEYFFGALEWLKAQPQVDPGRIVLAGLSRGAELALLLASMRSDVAGVAAFSPSSVVWRGVPPFNGQTPSPGPAWTLGGRPVPFQIDLPDPSRPVRASFERAGINPAARIPVERIKGPVLLASSKADAIWPADVYADEIAVGLRTRRPGRDVWTLQFDDASHLLMGTGPGINRLEIPGSAFTVDFGGTPEGTARARAEAWLQFKRFMSTV